MKKHNIKEWTHQNEKVNKKKQSILESGHTSIQSDNSKNRKREGESERIRLEHELNEPSFQLETTTTTTKKASFFGDFSLLFSFFYG